MKKNTLSWIAIVINALGLIIALLIERNIFLKYQEASGKTRALFGLNELGYLQSKFFLVLSGLIGLILIFVANKRGETRSKYLIALILSIFVIFIPFIGIWRWFV